MVSDGLYSTWKEGVIPPVRLAPKIRKLSRTLSRTVGGRQKNQSFKEDEWRYGATALLFSRGSNERSGTYTKVGLFFTPYHTIYITS